MDSNRNVVNRYYDRDRNSRMDARKKYDRLREPEWFKDRMKRAFGNIELLPKNFEISIDKLVSHDNQVVFCVPPLSQAAKYLENAAKDVANYKNSTVLFLITARTEAFSWHDHVFGAAHILFVKKPFRFVGLNKGLSAALIVYGHCPQEALDSLSDLGTIVFPAGVQRCSDTDSDHGLDQD